MSNRPPTNGNPDSPLSLGYAMTAAFVAELKKQ